ncbi:MAG TPA: hypothetical protein VJ735_14320 [Actinomycetes bacterium]|nr:hypothetical protein [Actinomycetes bacterium]
MLDTANAALGYLEELFPDSIGEACFIDRAGPENARMVRGVRATLQDLATRTGKRNHQRPGSRARPRLSTPATSLVALAAPSVRPASA